MLNKTYTIEDFKPNKFLNAPVYKDGGRICIPGYPGTTEMNYSTILSVLIGEAGRWCRYHAADLFIPWYWIESGLRDGTIESESMLFGFYESGVDPATFVLSRYNNPSCYGIASSHYRALWRLDIEVGEMTEIGKTVTMTLYEVQR